MRQIAEHWRSYICNVNDKLASIALDLGLRAAAPLPDKSSLLWMWVYLRSPRPDGLSDQGEIDTLGAIEDELAAVVHDKYDGIECGRITTDGHREFYFYGAHDHGFEAAVSATMHRFRDYRFDCDSQEDRQWDQYLNVLYPSEGDLQRIKNRGVLDVLQEKGDDLRSVRDVHHWIYFRSTGDRGRFPSSVEQLGYQIEAETHHPGDDHQYGLQITRDQSVREDEIDEAVLQLCTVAKETDAEYDGWETRIVVIQ